MDSEKVKEIKKGLECCINPELNCCSDCPYNINGKLSCLESNMLKDVLNLINEQENENERLKKDCADIANDYQEMGGFYYEEAQKNQQLKDKVTELESENKELRVVVDIANERTYRKKFTDEWRKGYQKELDKQGNGHIAGHPDFDLVYKLYFEQKDRIAELEKENTEQLKQFAERLKDKFYYVFGHEYEQSVSGFDTKVLIEHIDETLKEYEK